MTQQTEVIFYVSAEAVKLILSFVDNAIGMAHKFY